MVLSAARDRSSTESKFLPGLTRELLDDIEDDELRCGKKGEIIIVSFLTCTVLCCAEIMPGTSGSLPLSIGPGEKKNLERSSSLSIVGFSFFSQAGCVPGPDQPPSCSAQRRDRLQARNTRQPHGPAGVVLGQWTYGNYSA